MLHSVEFFEKMLYTIKINDTKMSRKTKMLYSLWKESHNFMSESVFIILLIWVVSLDVFKVFIQSFDLI